MTSIVDCSSLVHLEAASLEAAFVVDCSRQVVEFVEPSLVVASVLAIESKEQDPFL